MLERADAITNEVLEPITFVLAYPTVHILLQPLSLSGNHAVYEIKGKRW
jgi:hypothetical protein